MRSPAILHNYQRASHSARVICGTDSARSGFVQQPTCVLGAVDCASWPLFPHLFAAHGECSAVSSSPSWLALQHTPYRRTNAEHDSLVDERLWQPAWAPRALHHADAPRLRLMTAGFHERRRVGCAWYLFFPRSVGFGPTASSASGAFTMAPSILCHDHAMFSISSYSANPLRHIFTNTPQPFQYKKYLCTELALPYSFGSAFHWQPVLSTYTIASNTLRGSMGLRPPPGRRLYLRPFGRSGLGIRRATRSHNASDTVQDLSALMHTSIPQPPRKGQ